MQEEQRKRYLANPHLKLTDKMRRKLGITTNEVPNPDGVALELDDPTPQTHKEVVRRKKGKNAGNKSQTSKD